MLNKQKIQTHDKTGYNPFVNLFSDAPTFDRWEYGKNYVKVLFNTKRSLQNSELNEIGTNHQFQLSNIASYFVKSGQRIYQARITFTTDENYFIAEYVNLSEIDFYIGKDLIGETSGSIIRIVSYQPIDSESAYIYFDYITELFEDGEVFRSEDGLFALSHLPESTGKCLTASNEEGQIYIDGYSINVDSETIKTYDWQNKNLSICYFITKNIITYKDDPLLLDPCIESTNFNAPGADRYQLKASLFCYDINDETLTDQIKSSCYGGIIVENGVLAESDEDDETRTGKHFLDSLAKRTYNESGNYTVNPWITVLKDDPENENNYIASVQPGDGYIYGYYVKSLISKNIKVEKSRTSLPFTNREINVNDQLSVYVEYDPATLNMSSSGFPAFFESVQCMSQKNGTGTILTTSIVLGFNKLNNGFKIYLGDIENKDLLASTKSLKFASGYVNLKQNPENSLTSYEGKENPLVFPTNYSWIENVWNLKYETINSNYYQTGTVNNITSVDTRKKTLVEFSETINVANGIDKIVLSKEDIAEIKSIEQLNNKNTEDIIDIVSYISFDSGQTDFFYDKGSVYNLNSSKVNSFKKDIAIATSYQVTYSYFEHENNNRPFSAQSYPDYNKIPFFTSQNGVTYSLRDCIDFRIKKSEIGNITSFLRFGSKINFDCEIYTPRKDIVYVDSTGNFGVVKGIASLTPEFPEIPSNGMAISLVELRGWSPSVKDIRNSPINNQRFTMEDIGEIDIRIQKMNYAIAQQQLYNDTVKMQTIDSLNRDCYKTGIFADIFADYLNSDYTNELYSCCIDAVDNSMRVNFTEEHHNFILNETNSTNYSKFDKTVMIKPSGRIAYIKNDAMSEYINVTGMLFSVWEGSILLTPSVDTWIEDLGNTTENIYIDTPKPPPIINITTSSNTGKVFMNTGWGRGTVGGQMFAQQHGQFQTTTTTTTKTTTDYASSWDASSNIIAYNEAIEFMRRIPIKYKAIGMRPNITLAYAYFDQFDILPLMSNIKTNSNGECEGEFTIPENVPCGNVKLFFADKAETTFANGEFSSYGTTIWSITTVTYIEKWTIDNNNRKTESTTSQRTVQLSTHDPVAETFTVGIDPIIIESIDVYFYSKDESVPVEIFIVETDNGYPTNRKLPYASKLIPASEVKIGMDNPTNFKFDSPVFLNANTEYAFVVFTTSYDYNIYLSKVGSVDLKTGKGIQSQPYLGSFFNSQNQRTWTADQSKDLSFVLYRYTFPTNIESEIYFDIDQTSDFDVTSAILVAATNYDEKSEVVYQYKWDDEYIWNQFNNRTVQNFSLLKSIKKLNENQLEASLQLKLILKTNSSFVSPIVDLERVYGIFDKNNVQENDDREFPFKAGTYISKLNKIKNPASDIVVYLDEILPNRSKVEVSLKLDEYSPSYVSQGTIGEFGIDTGIIDQSVLKGKTLQLYYYNYEEKVLEPKTQLIFTGYDYLTRKVYIRAVSNINDFKNVQNETQNIYEGIFDYYSSLVILPILSEENIQLDIHSIDRIYNNGDLLYMNGYIYQSKLDGNTSDPSPYVSNWEILSAIKIISEVKQDPNTEWRKMELEKTNISYEEAGKNWYEFKYVPQIALEKEFTDFVIRVDMYSKNETEIPKIRNLKTICLKNTTT